MKKFSFRLQIVLDRAKQEEQEQQRLLADLFYAREDLLRRIAELLEERRQIINQLEAAKSATDDARKLHETFLYLESLANRISQLRKDLGTLDEKIEAQRQLLVAAMQKRQVLDKIYDRQMHAYRTEMDRLEQHSLEETVPSRWFRERGNAREWQEALDAVERGATHG